MSALTPDETILGLLVAQPQHGYQLLETFHDQDRLGQVWSLSTSQLYAVLKRLERQAWIVGQQIESENAPPRTEYAITQAGREQLMIWLNDPHPSPSIRRVRVEFLSRLYITRLLGHSCHPLLERQRQACQQEHLRLTESREDKPDSVGWLASELVIAQLDAVLQWIDRLEVVLDSSHL